MGLDDKIDQNIAKSKLNKRKRNRRENKNMIKFQLESWSSKPKLS